MFTNMFPTVNRTANSGLLRRFISGTFSQPEVTVTPPNESGDPGPSGLGQITGPPYKRTSGSVPEVVTKSSETISNPMYELKRINQLAESTRSLSYLEWVHERQTKRMQTRSEWFLSPVLPAKNSGTTKSACDFHLQHQASVETAVMHSSHHTQVTPVIKGTWVQRRRSWRTHYVRPKTSRREDGSETSGDSGPCTPLNTPDVPVSLAKEPDVCLPSTSDDCRTRSVSPFRISSRSGDDSNSPSPLLQQISGADITFCSLESPEIEYHYDDDDTSLLANRTGGPQIYSYRF